MPGPSIACILVLLAPALAAAGPKEKDIVEHFEMLTDGKGHYFLHDDRGRQAKQAAGSSNHHSTDYVLIGQRLVAVPMRWFLGEKVTSATFKDPRAFAFDGTFSLSDGHWSLICADKSDAIALQPVPVSNG